MIKANPRVDKYNCLSPKCDLKIVVGSKFIKKNKIPNKTILALFVFDLYNFQVSNSINKTNE